MPIPIPVQAPLRGQVPPQARSPIREVQEEAIDPASIALRFLSDLEAEVSRAFAEDHDGDAWMCDCTEVEGLHCLHRIARLSKGQLISNVILQRDVAGMLAYFSMRDSEEGRQIPQWLDDFFDEYPSQSLYDLMEVMVDSDDDDASVEMMDEGVA